MKRQITTATVTVTVEPASNEWRRAVSPLPKRFTGTTRPQTQPIAGAALGSVTEPIIDSGEVAVSEVAAG